MVAEGYRLDWDGLGVVEGAAAADGTGASAGTAPATGGSGGGPWTWNDVRLHRAAELARAARQAVFDKLQYTCTAGPLHSAPKGGGRASSRPGGSHAGCDLCGGRRRGTQQDAGQAGLEPPQAQPAGTAVPP